MRKESKLLIVQSHMWEGARSKKKVTVPETVKGNHNRIAEEHYLAVKTKAENFVTVLCSHCPAQCLFQNTLSAAQMVLGSSGLMSQIPLGRAQIW